MGGRAGGIDVVDEQNRCRWRSRLERTGDVPPPLGAGQATLWADTPRPLQERRGIDAPAARQLARQRLGWMVAALQRSLAVGRNERDAIHRDGRKRVHDDAGRPCREPPKASLLPRGDDPSHGLVVGDRSAGARERDAPPAAL